MNLNIFFAASLRQNLESFKMALADLSDSDLLQRPVPGANHGNWQLGHLVLAEIHIMKGVGAMYPELPAGFAQRYTKQTAGSDDPLQFATKAEILPLLERVRNATIQWVQTCPAERFGEKGPLPFTPTVADAVQAQIGHLTMHWGQIQVLRRKLGKPVLF